MPALFEPRCKACKHPNAPEINDRLNRGESSGQIVEWLKELGQPVSPPALARHRDKHLGVIETARAVVAQAQVVQTGAAVAQVVAGVELLDRVASLGVHILDKFAAITDPLNMSMEQVALLGTCMREVRAAVDTKHELLNGKNLNVNVTGGLAGLLAIGRADAPAALDSQPGAVRAGGPGPDALAPPGRDPERC